VGGVRVASPSVLDGCLGMKLLDRVLNPIESHRGHYHKERPLAQYVMNSKLNVRVDRCAVELRIYRELIRPHSNVIFGDNSTEIWCFVQTFLKHSHFDSLAPSSGCSFKGNE
jgi:hypothetical protein